MEAPTTTPGAIRQKRIFVIMVAFVLVTVVLFMISERKVEFFAFNTNSKHNNDVVFNNSTTTTHNTTKPSESTTSTTKQSEPTTIMPTITTTNTKYVNLVMISDRKDDAPLRAFVNSILFNTSAPVRLNYVSSKKADWLEELSRESFFSIRRYDSASLIEKVDHFKKVTGFRSTHYSDRYTMLKLFIPTLTWKDDKDAEKVLVVDDDIVFFDDIVPLWELVQRNTSTISLYCPIDPRRVEASFTAPNRSLNGHYERFCQGGMLAVPAKAEIADMFFQAGANIMASYPDFVSGTSDQDIVNRFFVDYHQDTDTIPCGWACDWNSCGHTLTRCQTCPSAQNCHAYHFLAHGYEIELRANRTNTTKSQWKGDVEHSWLHYYFMNTSLLLKDFIDRIKNSNAMTNR